mgnify:CR=1 FL=1
MVYRNMQTVAQESPIETGVDRKDRRELAEMLRHNGVATDTLSMGMSGDYRAAVFEGATIVRIGTALFGDRN